MATGPGPSPNTCGTSSCPSARRAPSSTSSPTSFGQGPPRGRGSPPPPTTRSHPLFSKPPYYPTSFCQVRFRAVGQQARYPEPFVAPRWVVQQDPGGGSSPTCRRPATWPGRPPEACGGCEGEGDREGTQRTSPILMQLSFTRTLPPTSFFDALLELWERDNRCRRGGGGEGGGWPSVEIHKKHFLK